MEFVHYSVMLNETVEGMNVAPDGIYVDCTFGGGGHSSLILSKLENGKLLTNGGRVLGVTAIADDLKTAIEKAYTKVETVTFDNAFYRKDIGQRALKAYGEK